MVAHDRAAPDRLAMAAVRLPGVKKWQISPPWHND